MYRKLGKYLAWVIVGVFLFLLALPLVAYKHTLSLLDEMPNKSDIILTQQEIDVIWSSNETCSTKECESISPYWVYRWILVATINDYVMPIEPNLAYSNVSKMASQIAISHMRQGHIKRVKMLWWHMTHAFLGIWIQRNWSANEITTKYQGINA